MKNNSNCLCFDALGKHSMLQRSMVDERYFNYLIEEKVKQFDPKLIGNFLIITVNLMK